LSDLARTLFTTFAHGGMDCFSSYSPSCRSV
jgi:hypothetical protein